MKVLNSTRFLFSISKIKLLSTVCILASIVYSYGQTFNECFPERYNFTCEDPYAFLLSMGIDVEQDIIPYQNLRRYGDKIAGHSYGGIFRDKSNTYYVKECKRILNEVAGSKLMHLIIGKLYTPEVKVVRTETTEKRQPVASIQLPHFRMMKNTKTSHKNILGEVELTVAMDFLGMVDRHPKNMGYTRLNSHTLLAARVDLDSCFDFETFALHRYTSKSNHLDLRHIYRSLDKYPKDQVINIMRKIVAIPDEKIIMTLFQTWVTLSRIGSTIQLETCFDLARKLIERKDAFRVALEDPHFIAYKPQYHATPGFVSAKKQARAQKKIAKRENSFRKKEEKQRIDFERKAMRTNLKQQRAMKKQNKHTTLMAR